MTIIKVVFGKNKFNLEFEDCNVKNFFELKTLIHSLIHVFPENQKLIHKGRVIDENIFDLEKIKNQVIMVVLKEHIKEEIKKECKFENCKFWGSDEKEGFCSECYIFNLNLEKKSKSDEIKEELFIEKEIDKIEEIKKKCYKCGTKKKSYSILKCRCGLDFCLKHLVCKDHDCQFDYIKDKKEKLENETKNQNRKKFHGSQTENGGNTCC